MGEIADAMLDGSLCEGCGAYIGCDVGYPQYCSPECAGDLVAYTPPPERPYSCNVCDRRFGSDEAQAQHRRDKHRRAL